MRRAVFSLTIVLLLSHVVAQAQTPSTMQQVFVVKQAFPAMKTIGVLCNTRNANKILKELTVATSSYALELVVYDVVAVQNLREQFDKMTSTKKIDILWMVPDGAADEKFGRRFLEEKSILKKIPLYSYSVDYVKEGSLLTVGMNDASEIKIYYNSKVSQMLGISFPAEVQPKLTPVD
jgi:ABC-type uncharacterized transport system substrate-binding protein